jgi:hypothetical protein
VWKCVCICVSLMAIRCNNNLMHLQWVGRIMSEFERKTERKYQQILLDILIGIISKISANVSPVTQFVPQSLKQ